MPRTRTDRAVIYVPLFYLLLFAVWQGIFSLRIVPDYVFPSPLQVGQRLYEITAEGLLWPSLKATLIRMVIGFSIAAAIGLVIGIMMGMSRVVNNCLKSLFLGLQTLPTAAWVPISLLIFGLSDNGIYFVIIMSSVAAIATSRERAFGSDSPRLNARCTPLRLSGSCTRIWTRDSSQVTPISSTFGPLSVDGRARSSAAAMRRISASSRSGHSPTESFTGRSGSARAGPVGTASASASSARARGRSSRRGRARRSRPYFGSSMQTPTARSRP